MNFVYSIIVNYHFPLDRLDVYMLYLKLTEGPGGGGQMPGCPPPLGCATVVQGRRQDFCSGGNIGQNFIHEFLSSPVLQWRRQNFGSGGHSAKMYSSKTFEKFIKNLHKNLKNSPKFFKNKS